MKEQNQQYFEEKFKRVFDKLEHIHVEVKRTNSRVDKLEDQVQDIRLHDAEAICPNTPIVKVLAEKETKNAQVRKGFYWVVGVILAAAALQVLSATGVI